MLINEWIGCSMSISIEEIISAVGADKIQVQVVSDNILKSKITKKDCELTIVTAKENAPVPCIQGDHVSFNSKNMGLLLWIDGKVFNEAMAKLRLEKGIKDA